MLQAIAITGTDVLLAAVPSVVAAAGAVVVAVIGVRNRRSITGENGVNARLARLEATVDRNTRDLERMFTDAAIRQAMRDRNSTPPRNPDSH